MGKTYRKYKGKEYQDRVESPRCFKKSLGDRKEFVWRGEGWSTTSQGGVGNKSAWKSPDRDRMKNDPDWEEKLPLKQCKKNRGYGNGNKR